MVSNTGQALQPAEDRRFRRSDEFWQFVTVGLHEGGFVLCLPYGKTERE
jgi:hypothetical protein